VSTFVGTEDQILHITMWCNCKEPLDPVSEQLLCTAIAAFHSTVFTPLTLGAHLDLSWGGSDAVPPASTGEGNQALAVFTPLPLLNVYRTFQGANFLALSRLSVCCPSAEACTGHVQTYTVPRHPPAGCRARAEASCPGTVSLRGLLRLPTLLHSVSACLRSHI